MNKKNSKPIVSVVIPSYNSIKHIRECLTRVTSQNASTPYEVIIIDSSNDGTQEIIENEFPQVRLFHFKERCSVGKARNIGTTKAEGEVIFFLDTDCIAESNWLEVMYTKMKSLGADGIGGSVLNGTPYSIMGTIGFYLEFFRFIGHNLESYETIFLMGGNSGFKKEVFKDMQYPDMSVGDDFTFTWNVANQNRKLVFLPEVAVIHMNKTSLLRVLRYQYKLGRGAYKYRKLISPRIVQHIEEFPYISFILPWAMLPWIYGTILRREGILKFLKFCPLIPLSFIANYFWAFGFFRELSEKKLKRNIQSEL